MEVMKKEKSLEEIQAFFFRKSMYRVMKGTLSFLLSGRPIKFILNIGGPSYTDSKELVVGLPKEFFKATYEEMYTAILALLGHESQHVLSSNFNEFAIYNKEETDILVSEGMSKRFASHFVHAIGNIIEDGRIEIILANRLPGYIPKLQFLNMYFWKLNEVTEETNELHALTLTILSLSKLGIYPKGYNKVFAGTRLDNEINKVKDLIKAGIKARTCKDGLDICRKIIATLKPYLFELYEDVRKEEEMMEQIMELLEDLIDDFNNSEEVEFNENHTHSPHIQMPIMNSNKKDKEDDDKKENNETADSGEEEDNKNKAGDSSSKSESDEVEEDEAEGEGNGEIDEEADEEKGDSNDSSNEGEIDSKNKSNNKKDDNEEDNAKNSNSNSKSDEDDNSKESKDKETNEEAEGDSDDSNNNHDKEIDSDNNNSNQKDKNDNNESSKENNSDLESETTELSEGVGTAMEEVDKLTEEFISEKIKEISNELFDEAREQFNEAAIEEKKNPEIKDGPALTEEEKQELEEKYEGCIFNEHPSNFPLIHDLPQEIKVPAKKFRKEIEKIFKDKSRLNINGQHKGILNQEDLYKVMLGDYNIFTMETNKNRGDYVVYILQDGSGSMSGQKEVSSAYALSIIEEGLKDIVPFKITTFAAWDVIEHYTVRNWNDKSKRNYAYNFLHYRSAMGGNEDGYSIRVATAELLKRPETDKVLIVLSDGLPSSIADTKEAIKEARSKKIHVVGIMFGSEQFREDNYERYKEMYQKNIIATSPQNIPSKLTKILKKILIR